MTIKNRIVFITVMILLFASACTEKKDTSVSAVTVPETVPQEQQYSGPVWPELALLETGENPLWFELGSGGPSLIASPDAASLTPYAPWPEARYVSGIQAWNGYLVLAVNRDGFLVLGAGSGRAAVMLYRVSGGGNWDPYTAESFFLWEDKPAVLLYRDDFFIEPAAPSPRPQVYALDGTSTVPLGVSVPALESFPSDGPWESEVVRRGPDGLWYVRMKEKGKAQNETAYFRTGNLAEKGSKISIGEWRNSELPEGPENAPALLAAVLRGASRELFPGQGGPERVFVVRAVSPDFNGPRSFSSVRIAGSSGAENSTQLYGCCRDAPEPFALAVMGDGRGLCSGGQGTDVQPFSLPALPDGFVYTGVALLGNVLLASWEEQQEAGIGAAGFMVMYSN